MNAPLPPIYRDSRRLLVHTEAMVRHFSRYHKYTVGTDLRRQAMDIMRRVHRACFDRDRVAEHLRHLVWLIDDYKLTLQLTMEVGAFTHGEKGQAHFNNFETAVNLAASIGKQCGGWQQKAVNRPRTPEGGSAAPGSIPTASP